MSNAILAAVSLDDSSGICSNFSSAHVVGLCIKAALAGNLTITGVNNSNGSPATWVVAAATAGFVAPPGAGLCNTLAFSYGNVADAGKAVAILQPL